jgi:RNA polymerase sigma factor (TIGR02999 family)
MSLSTFIASTPGEITQLLKQMRGRNGEAESMPSPIGYEQLRPLAGPYLRRELQPKVLVDEAYLKLTEQTQLHPRLVHCYCLAARPMRRILVDHMREARASKRIGNRYNVRRNLRSPAWTIRLLAIDQALDRLLEQSPRPPQVVGTVVFVRCSQQAFARIPSVPVRTMKRDGSLARGRLLAELSRG